VVEGETDGDVELEAFGGDEVATSLGGIGEREGELTFMTEGVRGL
jgi:hypothetical protein